MVFSSKQKLDVIPFKPTPVWEFQAQDTIRLQGAHGEEIVRCVSIDHAVGAVKPIF